MLTSALLCAVSSARGSGGDGGERAVSARGVRGAEPQSDAAGDVCTARTVARRGAEGGGGKGWSNAMKS
eukprot:3345788-Pleurochrysis_carterae.AAC.1